MRIALVHDYLNQYGGAERVLATLCAMFPDAPVYTLFYDENATFYRFARRDIRTSFLQHVPLVRKKHRFFIPAMPLAAESMRLKDFDVVISSSASYAKGVNAGDAFHITYCHTPLRYAWEVEHYVDTHPYFQGSLMRRIGGTVGAFLRKWDKRASRKPNLYIANSHFIADKIARYYDREADVIHPPVSSDAFYYDGDIKKDYFLATGRILHYKRFDLIVDAFNDLGLPLLIIGDGPERDAVRARARSSAIRFVPFVESETELRQYYAQARAFLFPQVEDFGLVAAEAMMCGTPVIAYRKGGAREIVEEGISGTFFEEQTPLALRQAVERFIERESEFRPDRVAESGRRFSEDRFRDELMEVLRAQGFMSAS